MGLRQVSLFAIVVSFFWSTAASAGITITEWMYNGTTEFIELTNLGNSPVDMTGWYYSDSARDPSGVDDEGDPTGLSLAPFGVVQPGEVVIITEALEEDFRDVWFFLPASVKIIAENSINLGRGDEINIYSGPNPATDLVDRLTYSDQTFPGSIRTNGDSGNPLTSAALGANDVYQWVLATPGDRYGSYTSLGDDVGNPGINVVPEPASVALMLLGVSALLARRRIR